MPEKREDLATEGHETGRNLHGQHASIGVVRAKTADALKPKGLAMFPARFKEHPRFKELEALVQSITQHESMEVKNLPALENMVRASLAFTVCFYGNLHAALRSIVDRSLEKATGTLHSSLLRLRKELEGHSFALQSDNGALHKALDESKTELAESEDADLQLRLFLDLADEELATTNIPTKEGKYSPHYVAMLEAAQAAGVPTSNVERFVGLMHKGINVQDAARECNFSQPLTDYFVYSLQCTESPADCFSTIALRELSLSQNFRVIRDHLPKDKRYEPYGSFLSIHINVDEGKDEMEPDETDHETHSKLMAKALTEVQDIDGTLDTMIRFYTLRKGVYDECVAKTPLYH